jgi:hypothetical protein
MAPIGISVVIAALASRQLLASGTFAKMITAIESLDSPSRLSLVVLFITFIAITSSVFESMNTKEPSQSTPTGEAQEAAKVEE